MSPSEYLDFETLLNEKLADRHMSLKQLSELSGIAIKHLENLSHGNYDQLPPAPYLRGYIFELGRILDFDAERWWENLKLMGVMKSSGRDDRLPKNRFSVKSARGYLGVGVVALLVILYLGLRFSNILGSPRVIIATPDGSLVQTSTNPLRVAGILQNGTYLTVNDNAVPVNADGSWSTDITLAPGPNPIKIVGKKFLGGETVVPTWSVFYNAPAAAATSTGQ